MTKITYIWLDDVREPPKGHDWIWVKNAEEALDKLRLAPASVISIDHDLGQNEDGIDYPSGYSLANHIERAASKGLIYNIINWYVHSAKRKVDYNNTVAAMEGFDKIQWQKVCAAD